MLTTDTSDLKTTEDAIAEDTAALEDTTQDCLAIQAKVEDFEAYNKNLSEELEALTTAKVAISEKTGDAEYRDNRSVLSSRGSLASSLPKKRELDRIGANRISYCFCYGRRDLLRRRSFREGRGFDQ